MFPSISKATPQSQASTSFTASKPLTITLITPGVTVNVNGITQSQNSISVGYGDIVTATVTTPADYVWHNFYYYNIDNVPQTFAVVNSSLYMLHVKPDDTVKRWYLYSPPDHTLTLQSASGVNINVVLGNNFSSVVTQIHVVLDPLSNNVYFVNTIGVQVSKITLPSAPMDYIRIPDKNSIYVLAFGGEVYEVFLNSTSTGMTPFFAAKNYSEFSGELGYVSRLPGEDLISYLRRVRSRQAIPPATCLTYNGNYLLAGGNGSIWVVDTSVGFNLVDTFDIDEYVLNIAPLPNNQGMILITQTQKVFVMDLNGNETFVHQGIALGQPALFAGKVYIPEGDLGKLLIYNPVTNLLEPEINLPDFSPRYITVVNNKMYISGNDTNRVLVFDLAMAFTEKVFPEKVTWVSVVNNTIVASHYLKSFKLLAAQDLFRIVGLGFPKRFGPVTHIGTNVSTVTTLGNDEVFAHTPANTWIWQNGRRTDSGGTRGTLLVDGDVISINYAARVPGLSRTNCVIGDSAYDYDTEAFAETYFPRNIDLPIQGTDSDGIHTRNITLPTFFKPCRMAIEFGAIKVNDAYYYGDGLISGGDRISVEIATNGNSSLPIFTLGARQFVIPISTKVGELAPTAIEQINLQPNSLVIEEVTITPLGSLYDYIIPGYYDIIVKKNGTDITGNYYQQFGSGDKLTAEFTSSAKKYDVKDVYILGPNSYKFVARNIVDNKINYLDYGNIQYPYVRRLDQFDSGTYTTAGDYGNIQIFTTPEIQYTTANLTVTGLSGNLVGNLTVLGGDTYFVLNGNLISNTDSITVQLNDQLALARNIVSYFDVPVQVVQKLDTGDDDGIAEVTVGLWGLLNRDIEKPEDIEMQDEFYIDQYMGAMSHINSLSVVDAAIELSRMSTRTVHSCKEILTAPSLTKADSLLLAVESMQPLNAEQFVIIQDVARPVVELASSPEREIDKSIVDYAVDLVLDNSLIMTGLSGEIVRLKPSQRAIPLKETLLYKETTVVENASTGVIDKNVAAPSVATEIILLGKFGTVAASSSSVLVSKFGIIGDGSIEQWIGQPSGGLGSNTVFKTQPSQRSVFASREEFFREKMFVLDGATTKLSTGRQEPSLTSANPIRIASPGIVPTISVVSELLESALLFGSSSTADLLLSIEKIADQLVGVKNISTDAEVSSSTASHDETILFISDTSVPEASGTYFAGSAISYPDVDINNNTSGFDISWDKHIKNISLDRSYVPYKVFEKDTNSDSSISSKLTQTILGALVAVPNKELNTYGQLDRSVPLFNSKSYGEWNKSSSAKNYTGSTVFVGVDPESLRVSDTTADLNPESLRVSDTTADLNPEKLGYSTLLVLKGLPPEQLKEIDTFSVTPPHKFDISNTMAITLPVVGELGAGAVAGQQFVTKNESSTSVVMDYRPKESNYILGPLEFITADKSYTTSDKLRYTIKPFENTTPVVLNFNITDRNIFAVMPSHAREEYPKEAAVMPVYDLEHPTSHSAKIYYGRNQFMEVGAIKPIWALYEYGMGSQTGSAMEFENTAPAATITMDWMKELPVYYTQALLVDAAIDNGYVWDQDIAVIYGAFATQADAVFAARAYTEFRPFMIMDTDLWSYRVILDTNLVCRLSTGRYPVAWLMRGG